MTLSPWLRRTLVVPWALIATYLLLRVGLSFFHGETTAFVSTDGTFWPLVLAFAVTTGLCWRDSWLRLPQALRFVAGAAVAAIILIYADVFAANLSTADSVVGPDGKQYTLFTDADWWQGGNYSLGVRRRHLGLFAQWEILGKRWSRDEETEFRGQDSYAKPAFTATPHLCKEAGATGEACDKIIFAYCQMQLDAAGAFVVAFRSCNQAMMAYDTENKSFFGPANIARISPIRFDRLPRSLQ